MDPGPDDRAKWVNNWAAPASVKVRLLTDPLVAVCDALITMDFKDTFPVDTEASISRLTPEEFSVHKNVDLESHHASSPSSSHTKSPVVDDKDIDNGAHEILELPSSSVQISTTCFYETFALQGNIHSSAVSDPEYPKLLGKGEAFSP